MPARRAESAIHTYSMAERSEHLDFEIRREGMRQPLERPHRHEYFQIQFNVEGATQQYLGAVERPFEPGMLSFVLPYRIHRVPHPPGSKYYIISFGRRFLRPELEVDPLDLEDVPIDAAPELAPFRFQEFLDFRLSEDEAVVARAMCETMLAENRARTFFSLELMRAELLRLIGLVCRRYQKDFAAMSRQQAVRRGRRDALGRVTRFVRENLSRKLTLEDAAAAAFLSPTYLAHLLKKETGRTFVELVTERRMDRAKDLLLGTDRRIGDIAAAVGFESEAYFSRRFQQLFEMSPRAFRTQLDATRPAKPRKS
jgi:AraC-like DNA-binding protein